jgi:hypothetical protein
MPVAFNEVGGGNLSQAIGRMTNGTSQSGYGILVTRDSTNRQWLCQLSSTGANVAASVQQPYALTDQGVWQFVVGIFDKVAGELRFWLNATKVSTPYAGAIFDSTTANFASFIGVNSNNAQDPSRFFPQYQDEVFFMNKALTDAEVAYLYNGGVGRAYSEL